MTLQNLHDSLADAGIAILEESALEEPGESRSPDLFEMIFWNVIIAFAVNLAASRADERIKEYFRTKDRKKLQDAADQLLVVVAPDELAEENVATVIAYALPEWLPLSRKRDLALKLARTLKAHLVAVTPK